MKCRIDGAKELIVLIEVFELLEDLHLIAFTRLSGDLGHHSSFYNSVKAHLSDLT